MSRTAWKVSVSAAVFIASVLMIAINGWFALFALIAFILGLLWSFDWAWELESAATTPRQRVWAVVVGIPQSVFGLMVFCIGLAMSAWLLYLGLMKGERQALLGLFGIAPVFLWYGFGWLSRVFVKVGAPVSADESQESNNGHPGADHLD